MKATILFLDGKTSHLQIHIYMGACLSGQPGAYVYRNGQFTWVKPGESVSFVETDSKIY